MYNTYYIHVCAYIPESLHKFIDTQDHNCDWAWAGASDWVSLSLNRYIPSKCMLVLLCCICSFSIDVVFYLDFPIHFCFIHNLPCLQLQQVHWIPRLVPLLIPVHHSLLQLHPQHSLLVLTWAITRHGRHCLPQKVSMHHRHVVTGLWSCSISVAPGERKAGEGEGGQEEQTKGHLCGQYECLCG